MTTLIKNGSQTMSLKISIHRLFNDRKLYSKKLSPQKSTEIHIDDLKKDSKSLDPGAVLLVVKNLKNALIWKGPIPISSDSIPIKINAETKKVFYGKTQLPSIASSPTSFNLSFGCFLVFIIFIIILWFLIVWSKKHR